MRWRFETKPTCARLVIAINAHIDVPLYAIPDDEFETLEKAAIARADSTGMTLDEARVVSWSELPRDKVLLAHREDDWKVSDPREIADWFKDAVDHYGPPSSPHLPLFKSPGATITGRTLTASPRSS